MNVFTDISQLFDLFYITDKLELLAAVCHYSCLKKRPFCLASKRGLSGKLIAVINFI